MAKILKTDVHIWKFQKCHHFINVGRAIFFKDDLQESVKNRFRTQMYFHTVESVWVPKFLGQSFFKKTLNQARNCMLNQSRYSKCNFFLAEPQTMVEILKFHSGTQQVYITGFPKKLWIHWAPNMIRLWGFRKIFKKYLPYC